MLGKLSPFLIAQFTLLTYDGLIWYIQQTASSSESYNCCEKNQRRLSDVYQVYM